VSDLRRRRRPHRYEFIMPNSMSTAIIIRPTRSRVMGLRTLLSDMYMYSVRKTNRRENGHETSWQLRPRGLTYVARNIKASQQAQLTCGCSSRSHLGGIGEILLRDIVDRLLTVDEVLVRPCDSFDFWYYCTRTWQGGDNSNVGSWARVGILPAVESIASG
jgi:hypothetical protein